MQHDVGVEHGDQAVEVAGPGGTEEGVDHGPLPGEVGFGRRGRLLHLAAGATGQLTRGGRRPVEDRGDLLERDGEAVVQDERHPFRRGQRLQHGHQRHAHGVGEQRLVLGLHSVGPVDDGVGHVDLQRLVGMGAAGAQDVEADAGHHGRQPRSEVLDLVGHGALQPQPGLLHGVVGLGDRAEHPVADRLQPNAVLFELLGKGFFVHPVTNLRAVVSNS